MKKQNRVAFFNILSTLLLKGISIFTAPLFSRLLGTGGYGVTSIYSIWAGASAIVLPMQTQGTLVNARIEYDESQQDKYHSAAMGLSVTIFAAFAAVILLFARPIASALKLETFLIYFMLLQAFGTFSVSFLSTKFTYEFKAGWNMLLSLGITLTTLVLSVVLILQLPRDINYYGRIAAVSLTYGIIGIPACIWVLARGKTFFRRDYWKFCLYLALPSVFYNLSDLILGQSDRVMLQQMLSASAVGQYSLALNFGGIMFTIFGALNKCWTPFFFDDFKEGKLDRVHSQGKNFLELFTVLSVGFILLAPEVYHIFASREFWDGTVLIPIFVSSYFLNFLCTFPVNYEYYHKKNKTVAVVTILSSLINIGLNYILIRRMGMVGAALATAISHSLQLTMHYIYCRFFIGATDYPFGIRLWGKYAACFFVVVALVYASGDMWYLRWIPGAALGLWELYRISKRKVLI